MIGKQVRKVGDGLESAGFVLSEFTASNGQCRVVLESLQGILTTPLRGSVVPIDDAKDKEIRVLNELLDKANEKIKSLLAENKSLRNTRATLERLHSKASYLEDKLEKVALKMEVESHCPDSSIG